MMNEYLLVVVSYLYKFFEIVGEAADHVIEFFRTIIFGFVEMFGVYLGGFIGVFVVVICFVAFLFMVYFLEINAGGIVRWVKNAFLNIGTKLKKRKEDTLCYLVMVLMRKSDAVYGTIRHSITREDYMQQREFKMYKIK